MSIKAQKRQKTADERGAQHYHVERAVADKRAREKRNTQHNRAKQCVCRRYRRGKPVQSVGKVDRVGKRQEYKNVVDGREPTEFELFGHKRRVYRRSDVFGIVRVHGDDRCEHDLKYNFLHRGQTLVVLIPHFYKVVNKPDERVPDSHY